MLEKRQTFLEVTAVRTIIAREEENEQKKGD